MAQVSLKSYENEIRDLIKAGAFDQAMDIGQHILQYYPKHLQTYAFLGESCLGKELYQEAVDLLLRVLSVDPENVSARVGLSRAYEAQGDINSAIEQMRAALDLAPSLTHIHTEMHRLLRRQSGGQASKLKLTRQGLGRIYIRGGLYTQAADEFEALLMETPDQVDIQVSLAEVLWRDGQRIRAIEVCQSVLNKLPYCLKTHLILAETWLRSDREDEAEAHLKIIQELDPDGEIAYRFMGDASPLSRVSVTLPDMESASEATMQESTFTQPTEAISPGERPGLSEQETLEADILVPPIQAGETAEAPLEFEAAEIPEWLQEAKPQGVEGAISTEAGAIADAEIPAWLAAGAAGAAIAQEAQEIEKQPESPDETTGIDSGESIEEIPEEGIPDWLRDAAPQEIQVEATVEESTETPTTELSLSEEVATATIAAVGATEAAEEEELPPWLRDIPEEGITPEEVPATVAEVPPETEIEEKEIPSWLRISPDEGTAPEEITAVATEVPSEGEPVEAEAQEAVTPSTEEASTEHVITEEELLEQEKQEPTWLRILREEDLEDELQSEETLAAMGAAAAITAAEISEEEDIPPAATVEVPPAVEPAEAEIREVGEDITPTMEEAEWPAWLRDLQESEDLIETAPEEAPAAREPSDLEEIAEPGSMAQAAEEEPAWLRDLREAESKEETDLPSEESLLETGLIDTAMTEAEPAEALVAATTTALQPEAVSEEVVPGDKEIGQAQPTEESQIDLPTEENLEQMGLVHEDIATEQEERTEEKELPDWLRKAALAEGLVEEITGDEALEESEETPEWLELLQREGTSQYVMPEEPDSDEATPQRSSALEEEDREIPAWLQMLRQGQQEERAVPEEQTDISTETETAALSEERVAISDLTTVAEVQVPEQVEEEPALPTEEPKEEIDLTQIFPDQGVDEATTLNYENMLKDNPEDHSTRWELIQAYANAGDHTTAVEHSEQLIRSGSFATEITAYLETITKAGVETREAYQTLGEAYFKQNRLQEAMEAYRKALSQLG